MMNHSCDIILSRQILKINGEEVYCHTNEFDFHGCRIALTEDIEIPPESEIVISGRTIDPYDNAKLGVTSPNLNLIEKHSVLLARALVQPFNGLVPLQIAIFDSIPIKLHKNTIVAHLEKINKDSIPAFQEHLVHHTNVATSIKNHDNNQPETPEHIKDLIEATLQNVSEKEGQQVKSLLIEYADVFCTFEDDMGRTD
ncbi:hypothetical protein DPMN_082396 [Dreissena polymorpha]|uniref:Uncharacterized protein n=1 Tax=Dreissena polymorpha TaxID=45954 RepID=A0A9D3YAS9_DREPO|nr:hypothetical protein DPMN_082396 [Dreissena polymorpha]